MRVTRDLLHPHFVGGIRGLVLNGHREEWLPSTLNVSFPGVGGRKLRRAVEGTVAASVGGACHSDTGTVSGVPAAMGVGIERAAGAVRLSVGFQTTDDEIRQAAGAISAISSS